MKPLYRSLFWMMAATGRRFGGIRPRRIVQWVGEKGFGNGPELRDFGWWKDQWGSELRLNPFYFLDRSIIAFGRYDEALSAYIETHVKQGMVCFDVGANIGTMSVHLGRRVGQGGRVHAFEPVPRVRGRLEENVRRNGLEAVVNIWPIALSDRQGHATMLAAPEGISNQGEGSLVGGERSGLGDRFEVETMSIDAFVEREEIRRIDFMKVDIQGAEPLLLARGKRVFGEMGPDVMMEISGVDLAESGKTSPDLVRQIEGYGYQVYHLELGGKIGRRLKAEEMAAGYCTANAYCTKQSL